MKHKNYIHGAVKLIMFLAFVLIILNGCSLDYYRNSSEKSTPVHPKDIKREIIISKATDTVVVYFATSDGNNLVPVTLDVNPTEQMAKVAVEKLLAGPSDDLLHDTIPDATKLKDLYKFDKIAYVDLTEDFLKAKKEKEASMAVEALVFTLTEFPQVDSVQILINGKIVNEKYGKYDISKPLQRPKEINFYGEKGKNLYKVYYSDINAMYLVPLSFATDKNVTPQMVVERLLKDPPKESNLGKSPIWKGTKFLGVFVKGDTAEVDLSKEALAYGGGSANELNLVNSLTFSLTELPGIKKVELLIEGKKPDYLPEGTDISKPWERPVKINYIQK